MTVLKLDRNPLSSNSPRVWIALLEKEIEFELAPLKLNGDQFQLDFLAVSPFYHVPVLADGDFHVIETLAIIDCFQTSMGAGYGCISILQGRSISADNLLVRTRDLLPKCFAPTNIFAKMRCTPGYSVVVTSKI